MVNVKKKSIFRGFTYRLCPTAAQEESFRQFSGVCRLVWNLALEQRQNHYRNYEAITGSRLNFFAQARELTILRNEVDFVKAAPQSSQRHVLRALDTAYQRFFSGLGGYPKPKKKGDGDSFTFDGRNVDVERLTHRIGRVKLPKIGWVRCYMPRDISGKITKVTVTLTALGWQASIGCKDCAVRKFATEGAVGIDRGVAIPLMLSDGTSYSLPNSINVLERRARKQQRIVSRRRRGSRRYAKALRRVSATKAKQARIRKHWAHETTTAICEKYGTIVIENLKTRNMTASASGTVDNPGVNVAQKRGLNRSILNVGWFQIETMFSYKSHELKKVNPRFTSQTCSCCGAVDSRSRESQSSFVCTVCGFRTNADYNSAINILNRGITPVVKSPNGVALKRELHPV